MADIVRTAAKFQPFADALSCHLVEVSPELREKQRHSICGKDSVEQKDERGRLIGSCINEDSSSNTIDIQWHDTFTNVPYTSGVPCVVIAQEF